MAIALLFSFVTVVSSRADWTDPATGPVVIQDGFGDYGQNMPGYGSEYCQPTAAVMSLLWLGQNGFSQIGISGAFTSQNTPVVENLERLVAGLMNTSATAGTSQANAITGLETYLDAEGLSGLYTHDDSTDPSIAWLSSEIGKNSSSSSITFVDYGVAWYSHSGTGEDYTSSGAHDMELLSVTGTGSTGVITLHDPAPSALADVPDLPQYSLQTAGLAPVPADWNLVGEPLPASDYLQLETSTVGDDSHRKGILDHAYAWTISASALPDSSGYQPAAWALDADTSQIDTNGATFSVLAPIIDGADGPIGFTKTGLGTLQLTNADNATGTNFIEEGGISSTYTGGALFGTGWMSLKGNSVVSLQPGGGGGTVALLLASGSGSVLALGDGGGLVSVDHGAYAGSTLVIGGNTDGVTPNISLSRDATLVFAVTSGSGGLGTTDQILVAGSGGNLPGNNSYGIVSPAIVGQNNDPGQSGFFLKYDATQGFEAAETVTADINNAIGKIFEAATDQTVSDSGASVGALQVDSGVTVSGGPLNVGSNNPEDISDVILNGGAVSAALNFGFSKADIYASLLGGTISSSITGLGGLVTFGPGNLTLSGNNGSSLSGNVYVNSGTLTAAGMNSSGAGNVTVASAAAFVVGSGATVAGSVDVKTDGTLILAGGTVNGSVTTDATGNSTAETGGIVEGYGVISGSVAISGQIEPGPAMGTLEFGGDADLRNSVYYWNLASLVSDTDGTPGSDWNLLAFDSSAHLQDMHIFVEFGAGVDDPNSTDPFWDTTHEWVLFEFADPDWSDTGRFVQDATFADGTFSTLDDRDAGVVYLEYDPVPEPSTLCLFAGGILLIFAIRRKMIR